MPKEPDWSVPGMMNARDALNDTIGSAPQGSRQQSVLMGIRDRIDDSLSAVPAERQARQTYAEMNRPLDAFKSDMGAPFVEGVVEKDRFGGKFMLPTSGCPASSSVQAMQAWPR
ncbi:hypothetical protein [Reyranella sp.]|uniref:hypothetical protein n=1 Tax=Reyranella sp. TaxID=1929291 RepID=UPI0012186844|nr:hypothetical protein [Reyranella sp.]TAJ91008.1 MAG: hypothetical protein EPO50_00315 [Reyranella sp.]